MPALAQPTAELWNTVFNLILVVGAILVLAGTWGAFWTGNMKEFYANARISANEALTATANAEAGRANEAAANANERTVQTELALEQERVLRLKLEQRVAWRRLSSEQLVILTEEFKAVDFPIYTLTNTHDPEASGLLEQILSCLKSAQVEVWPQPWASVGTGIAIIGEDFAKVSFIHTIFTKAGITTAPHVQRMVSIPNSRNNTVEIIVNSQAPSAFKAPQ